MYISGKVEVTEALVTVVCHRFFIGSPILGASALLKREKKGKNELEIFESMKL